MAMSAEQPDDIDLLLPLQAAGLLSGRDRERVEAALARDPAKARALARMRLERAAVIEANETIPLKQAALSRLMRDVEAEPARAAPARGIWRKTWAAVADLAGPAPALRFAALFAAALIGGILMRGDGYQVAGGGQTRDARGPVVIVGFNDDAKAAAIQDALRQAGATVIAGPKGNNFFEVRFRVGEGLAPVDERIRQLEARGDVIRHLSRAGD
jgi:anti-sigma factor RsiW